MILGFPVQRHPLMASAAVGGATTYPEFDAIHSDVRLCFALPVCTVLASFWYSGLLHLRKCKQLNTEKKCNHS